MKQDLYNERLKRIRTAIELGKPDRVPVVLQATAFCANYMGVGLADFCSSPVLSSNSILKTIDSLGEVDGITFAQMNPRLLSMDTLSRVKVPGAELPESTMWQVDEQELMKTEDYDFIIDKGLNIFLQTEYFPKRMDNLMAKLGPTFGFLGKSLKNARAAGVVTTMPVAASIPFEMFSGGRSIAKFSRDLFKMPEKVVAAIEAAMPDIIAGAKKVIGMAKPFGVMVPMGRASGGFLSRKMQEKFAFPYFKKLVESIVEEGVYAMLHLDSNWDRDIDFFREMPKGKCVFQADGSTNIYKLKEILGGHICIQGDVPAALLTLGTPDEVYNYSVKLIRDIGPSGFILASGCEVPPNAKPENVVAMITAAAGK